MPKISVMNWKRDTTQRLRDTTQRLMELKRLKVLDRLKRLNGKYLDAGCGPINIIQQLETIGEYELTVGIDCNSKMIQRCKQQGGGHPLILSDIQKMPFNAETFDVVTALDVIEHLKKPSLAIKKIHRVLRPGGVLIVTTPNWPDKIFMPLRKLRDRAYHNTYGWNHLSAHSCYGWSRLIQSNGFKVQSLRTVKFPLIHSEFLANKLPILGMTVLIEAIKK